MHSLENVTRKPQRREFVMRLHNEAIAKSKAYQKAEGDLLEVLTRVEENRIYLDLEFTSLHQYAMTCLMLTSHVANDFINVMRTSKAVPELAAAIFEGKTTISKARRVCSVITPEDQEQWIDLLVEHPCRVVEKCVAMQNPRAAVQESLKYVSGDVLELKLAVSEEWAKLLKTTKDRLSQKCCRAVSTEEALFHVMNEDYRRNDPVEKAKRTKARKEKREMKGKTNNDTKLQSKTRSRYRKADVRNSVTLRDEARCVFVDSTGKRCDAKRWLNQHHIVEFAKGGEHAVDNLETLCWAHHRMRHVN